MRPSAALVLPLLAVTAIAAGEEPALNRDMQIVLANRSASSPAEEVIQAIASGRTLQAIATIPAAASPGGPLLNPASVRVNWNERSLDTFVYYKQPHVAVLFTLLPVDTFEDDPNGKLTMEASFIGAEGPAAGWQLPIVIPDEAFTSATLSQRRPGRVQKLLDQEGEPADGAFLFGQRRSDLYARADDAGVVILDATNRNTPDRHYAWGAQTWTTAFDPVSSPTITLMRRDPADARPVSVALVDEQGNPVSKALLMIDNRDYVVYTGDTVTVEAPTSGPLEVLAIAAGHSVAKRVVEPVESTVSITLRRAAVRGGQPPP